MSKKLYVGNLSWGVDDAQLREFFAAVGTVEEAVVIIDKFKNRSRGFGFVTMSTEEEAQAAVDQLNGKDFDGRAINVSFANEERKPRSGGFGGGFRNRDRGGYNDGM